MKKILLILTDDIVIRMLFIIIYTFRHIVYFHCTIFLQYFLSKPTCIVIHSAVETIIKWLKCKWSSYYQFIVLVEIFSNLMKIKKCTARIFIMISDFKSHIRTHGYFFYRMYYYQFSSLITQVMQLFSAIIRYLQESLKKA